jgi:hypothetical protein
MQSRDGWQHRPGSSFAAWTRTAGRSRVVYIQPGDAACTLDDSAYRTLVSNAVTWVAEPATRA